MKDESEGFESYIFSEITYRTDDISGNIIKGTGVDIIGKTKIEIEEESHEGVKIILKKDGNENIKEIKFVCSCGQTKSLILDYSEE